MSCSGHSPAQHEHAGGVDDLGCAPDVLPEERPQSSRPWDLQSFRCVGRLDLTRDLAIVGFDDARDPSRRSPPAHHGYGESRSRPRPALMAPRRFFASSRRRWDPRVGRVALRRAGGGVSASRRMPASLSRAAARLRDWDRCSEAAITIRPPTSRPSRLCSRRARCGSLKADEDAGSNRSSTRLSVVLTDCPPGPGEREKRSSNSPAGIVRPCRIPGAGGTLNTRPGSATVPVSPTPGEHARFLSGTGPSRRARMGPTPACVALPVPTDLTWARRR